MTEHSSWEIQWVVEEEKSHTGGNPVQSLRFLTALDADVPQFA